MVGRATLALLCWPPPPRLPPPPSLPLLSLSSSQYSAAAPMPPPSRLLRSRAPPPPDAVARSLLTPPRPDDPGCCALCETSTFRLLAPGATPAPGGGSANRGLFPGTSSNRGSSVTDGCQGSPIAGPSRSASPIPHFFTVSTALRWKQAFRARIKVAREAQSPGQSIARPLSAGTRGGRERRNGASVKDGPTALSSQSTRPARALLKRRCRFGHQHKHGVHTQHVRAGKQVRRSGATQCALQH